MRLRLADYAYDKARDCRKRPTPGALALESWLERNAEGTSWGIMRCERWGKNRASLHAEGRAVDWHLDASRPADRREARRLIDLWLATDSAGNEHALARRMGIQEIIWNCHSWWSGSDGMGKYSACYTERGRLRRRVNYTEAHKDHIHIGLSWAGRASGRVSGRRARAAALVAAGPASGSRGSSCEASVRARLGNFERWWSPIRRRSIRRAGSGVPSMLSFASMAGTVSCAPLARFGRGFLAIMRMGIRCRLRVMSRLS